MNHLYCIFNAHVTRLVRHVELDPLPIITPKTACCSFALSLTNHKSTAGTLHTSYVMSNAFQSRLHESLNLLVTKKENWPHQQDKKYKKLKKLSPRKTKRHQHAKENCKCNDTFSCCRSARLYVDSTVIMIGAHYWNSY